MLIRVRTLFACVVAIGLTSCGKDTTGPVPVAVVELSAPATSLVVGESLQLSAKAMDASGSIMTDRTITWSSSDTSRATVSQTGLVTTRARGSVRITASSEGQTAFVDITVLPVPLTISTTVPSTLVAGENAVINGTGFSASPSENTVTLGGVPVTVVSATTTAITIAVPPNSECVATRSADVQVKVEDRSATKSVILRSVYMMQLAVGQSAVVSDPARLACTEFPDADAKFVIAVVNVRDTTSVDLSYRITGKSGAAAVVQAWEGEGMSVAAAQAHSTRAVRPAFTRTNRIINPSVIVGEKRTFYVPGFDGQGPRCVRDPMSFSNPTQITARAVYVGQRSIIWADENGYSAGQADAALIELGQKMDNYYPALTASFGDPLATDSVTDKDGHFGVIVSGNVKPVTDAGYTQYYHNGGYINPCDFKPFEPPQSQPGVTYGGNYSNFGEYVYSNSASPYSAAHTLQHLIDRELSVLNPLPAKPVRASSSALAEGMAELNEEYYSRTLESPVGWKTNSSTCCVPPASSLGELRNNNNKHDLNGTNLIHVPAISWSFMRWYVDQFAFTEQATLRALTDQQGLSLTRLAELVVLSKEYLLGNWALALYADGLSQFANNSALNIATWNLRGLLPPQGPVIPENLTFGDFVIEDVLRPTGFKHFMLNTFAGQSHLLMMRQAGGTAPLPSDIKLAIARVQ